MENIMVMEFLCEVMGCVLKVGFRVEELMVKVELFFQMGVMGDFDKKVILWELNLQRDIE